MSALPPSPPPNPAHPAGGAPPASAPGVPGPAGAGPPTGAGAASPAPLRVREVASVWAPLAGSWLLMGLELPLVSAAIARLPDPTVSLAAYGGAVFPLALLIESPIIMLLAASTALSRDEASYRLVRRFMRVVAGGLTLLHALLAFTPLFDFVVAQLLGIPEEVREPARIGLRIMLPWSFSVAYRRTQQGLLIRFGRPKAVTQGTAVRLTVLVLVLAVALVWGRMTGIVAGTLAVAGGVVSEAVFAGWVVRPLRRRELRAAPRVTPPLDLRRFLRFYVPLMVTPSLAFLALPLSAAAMSRMPLPIESLAIWPALSGIAFTLRSLGFAYNEVVVASLEAHRPVPALRRFATLLGAGASAALALLAFTPLGRLWFRYVAGLAGPLAALAAAALPILAVSPALSVTQSFFQGSLVHSGRTRGVTEAMVALLVATIGVLGAGLAWGRTPGIFFAAGALLAGNAAQTGWLWLRGRREVARVAARDPA